MGSGTDVLLGDFNIDAFDEVTYGRLKDTLSSYSLKVLEPTRLDGDKIKRFHIYYKQIFKRWGENLSSSPSLPSAIVQ